MEVMVLGAAAGLVMAAACMVFYRKGLRDGMDRKRGAAPQPLFGGGKTQGDNETAALMRKYETILSYDPYASPEQAGLWNAGGDRA